MSYRSRTIRGGALATLAALLGTPAVAHAGTVQTFGSFDEMPRWLQIAFIGVFVAVGLVLVIAIALNVRRPKADPEVVEDAMAQMRAIMEDVTAGGANGGTRILSGAPPTSAGDAFAEIKTADPAFNEERFKGRVNEVFLSIKYAWAARDLAPVRRFMTDEQFAAADVKLQAEFVAKGRTPGVENLFVTSIVPVAVSRQGEFDSVTVRVEGSAIASTTDERTGRLVNPDVMGDGKTPRPFREAWTLIRKVGVQSRADATLQQCPNCLAPVAAGADATCAYCGVEMNDPAVDWAVARIEHAG